MKSLFLFNIYIFTFQSTIYSQKIFPLTKEILIKTEWNTWGRLFNYGHALTFKPSGKFELKYAAEGGGECKDNFDGNYFLSDQSLTLFPIFDCKESKNSPPQKINCYIKTDSKDPFFEAYLLCGKDRYYGAFEKIIGSQINLFGTESILVKRKKVKSKTNIKVREKPSVNSKFYNCRSNTEKNFRNPYLPKGRQLEIRARTLSKEIIDGIEDFWYFAREDFDWIESCSIDNKQSSMVWVFGGYLE